MEDMMAILNSVEILCAETCSLLGPAGLDPNDHKGEDKSKYFPSWALEPCTQVVQKAPPIEHLTSSSYPLKNGKTLQVHGVLDALAEAKKVSKTAFGPPVRAEGVVSTFEASSTRVGFTTERIVDRTLKPGAYGVSKLSVAIDTTAAELRNRREDSLVKVIESMKSFENLLSAHPERIRSPTIEALLNDIFSFFDENVFKSSALLIETATFHRCLLAFTSKLFDTFVGFPMVRLNGLHLIKYVEVLGTQVLVEEKGFPEALLHRPNASQVATKTIPDVLMGVNLRDMIPRAMNFWEVKDSILDKVMTRMAVTARKRSLAGLFVLGLMFSEAAVLLFTLREMRMREVSKSEALASAARLNLCGTPKFRNYMAWRLVDILLEYDRPGVLKTNDESERDREDDRDVNRDVDDQLVGEEEEENFENEDADERAEVEANATHFFQELRANLLDIAQSLPSWQARVSKLQKANREPKTMARAVATMMKELAKDVEKLLVELEFELYLEATRNSLIFPHDP